MVVVPAAKEEVQKIATDSRDKLIELRVFQIQGSQKAQVRTRGGDFRPAALVQLGNGTMATNEERAEIPSLTK